MCNSNNNVIQIKYGYRPAHRFATPCDVVQFPQKRQQQADAEPAQPAFSEVKFGNCVLCGDVITKRKRSCRKYCNTCRDMIKTRDFYNTEHIARLLRVPPELSRTKDKRRRYLVDTCNKCGSEFIVRNAYKRWCTQCRYNHLLAVQGGYNAKAQERQEWLDRPDY